MLDMKILQAEIYQEGDCKARGQRVREEENPRRGGEGFSTSGKTTRKTCVSLPTLMDWSAYNQFYLKC